MVGGVGETLALYGHSVVVSVAAAGFAERGAVEPVAGVDLGGRLVGPDFQAASRSLRAQFSGQFESGLAVQYPAVVVTLAVAQGGEVRLDVAAYGLGGAEVHGSAFDGGELTGGYEGLGCYEPAGGVDLQHVVEDGAVVLPVEVPVGVVGQVHDGRFVGGGLDF